MSFQENQLSVSNWCWGRITVQLTFWGKSLLTASIWHFPPPRFWRLSVYLHWSLKCWQTSLQRCLYSLWFTRADCTGYFTCRFFKSHMAWASPSLCSLRDLLGFFQSLKLSPSRCEEFQSPQHWWGVIRGQPGKAGMGCWFHHPLITCLILVLINLSLPDRAKLKLELS